MKNNNIEISNEDFLLAALNCVSTSIEDVIFQYQSIIEDEKKKSVLKRDYKIILECRIEIRKARLKLKKKSPEDYASEARLCNIITDLYCKTKNQIL